MPSKVHASIASLDVVEKSNASTRGIAFFNFVANSKEFFNR